MEQCCINVDNVESTLHQCCISTLIQHNHMTLNQRCFNVDSTSCAHWDVPDVPDAVWVVRTGVRSGLLFKKIRHWVIRSSVVPSLTASSVLTTLGVRANLLARLSGNCKQKKRALGISISNAA